MRRVILLACVFVISFQLVNAQDVFKEHGFDKEPLTLSNGHYNEFFTNDEVVQIGTVLLNTKTNKIVAFVDEDDSETPYMSELSSRWSSPDPLAAKYPEVSPYVYALNNPIKYIDPDGRKIVDVNGNIIYTQQGGWVKNAPADAIRIGNAMMLTPVGYEAFNQLSDASYEVTFAIGGRSQDNDLGNTTPAYDKKSGELVRADIIVFEGNIKDEVNLLSETKQFLAENPNYAPSGSDKGNALLQNLPTVEERIGQVGVHEWVHVTNKQAQSRYNPDRDSREGYANAKEMEAIRQTPEYRLKEIQLLPGKVWSN